MSQSNTMTHGSVVQNTPTPGPIKKTNYPNYVKPREGLLKPLTSPTPYIEAQLVPTGNNEGYIQYKITDQYGPGRLHHKRAKTCENDSSDLFTTKFDYSKYISAQTVGGEVKITGYVKNSTVPIIWTTKSKISNNYADDDTAWDH
jgi:hypothetical protein